MIPMTRNLFLKLLADQTANLLCALGDVIAKPKPTTINAKPIVRIAFGKTVFAA